MQGVRIHEYDDEREVHRVSEHTYKDNAMEVCRVSEHIHNTAMEGCRVSEYMNAYRNESM